MYSTITKRDSFQVNYLRRPSILNRQVAWGALFIAATIWALSQTGLLQSDVVNPGGWALVGRFIQAFTRPDLSPEFLLLTLDATLTTLAFAVGGIFISVVFGLFGGVLASEVWWSSVFPKRTTSLKPLGLKTPWLISRSLLAFPRAIHEIIWGLFFINIIGLDPLSAILAIAIPYGAITAKVFSEILDETPPESLVALLNSGVSPIKAFSYSLLPRAFSDLMSYSFYRFECAIRSAAVLGLIGAGGLGYEIFLSLQTLKYEQIWTLLFALFILNGLADYWSFSLRNRIGFKTNRYENRREFEIPWKGSSNHQHPGANEPLIRFSIWAAILLVPLSFVYTKPDFGKLISSRGVQQFNQLAQASWPPEFSLLSTQGWLLQTGTTLSMSLLAVAFAGLFATILIFMAANWNMNPASRLSNGIRWSRMIALIRFFTRGFLLISRSIPSPIWALMLLFVFFPGILPGALALGIFTLGVFSRLMAEVIENLDNRPMQALKAQGASTMQVISYGFFPLTFPRFIAYLLIRWEEAIRATVVIGLVGAGGLGRLLIEQLSSFNYNAVTAILIVFIGLTILVDQISAIARRDFRKD